MGYSIPRVLAGFLASAAMVGAFVCAVLVIQPLAGGEPRWPDRLSEAASAETLNVPVPSPRADVVPAARALAQAAVARVAVPRVVHRAAKPALRERVPIDRAGAPPARTPAPARPASPAEVLSAAASPAAPQTSAAAPLAPVADAVSSTARSVGQAVAPVSPEAGSTVEQAGAAVAQIVGGP